MKERKVPKEVIATRLSTGVTGLDEILHGGFLPGRAYLVRGRPGCGKTTLGLHFLTAGMANGETVLFLSLGEPGPQLRSNAKNKRELLAEADQCLFQSKVRGRNRISVKERE